MRTGAKIAVAVIVLGGLGALAWWRHGVADQAEQKAAASQKASDAMRELNKADEDLPKQIETALEKVTSAAVLSIDRARGVLADQVLPLFDAYVAKFDQALSAADAYLALAPEDFDPDTRAALDKVRVRAKGMHAARDRIVALRDKIAAGGVTLEILAQELAGIAAAMITGK